jgi:hypothetical protein
MSSTDYEAFAVQKFPEQILWQKNPFIVVLNVIHEYEKVWN